MTNSSFGCVFHDCTYAVSLDFMIFIYYVCVKCNVKILSMQTVMHLQRKYKYMYSTNFFMVYSKGLRRCRNEYKIIIVIAVMSDYQTKGIHSMLPVNFNSPTSFPRMEHQPACTGWTGWWMLQIKTVHALLN